MSLLFMCLFYGVADLMANKAFPHISRILGFFLILHSKKYRKWGSLETVTLKALIFFTALKCRTPSKSSCGSQLFIMLRFMYELTSIQLLSSAFTEVMSRHLHSKRSRNHKNKQTNKNPNQHNLLCELF